MNEEYDILLWALWYCVASFEIRVSCLWMQNNLQSFMSSSSKNKCDFKHHPAVFVNFFLWKLDNKLWKIEIIHIIQNIIIWITLANLDIYIYIYNVHIIYSHFQASLVDLTIFQFLIDRYVHNFLQIEILQDSDWPFIMWWMNSEKNDVFQGNPFNHNDLIEYFLDMLNKANKTCKIPREYDKWRIEQNGWLRDHIT